MTVYCDIDLVYIISVYDHTASSLLEKMLWAEMIGLNGFQFFILTWDCGFEMIKPGFSL